MELKRTIPFIVSLFGTLSDLMTTQIGLNQGLYEIHPQYNPLIALVTFWGIIALLTFTLPINKIRKLSTLSVALTSYLGTINNTLHILTTLPRMIS